MQVEGILQVKGGFDVEVTRMWLAGGTFYFWHIRFVLKICNIEMNYLKSRYWHGYNKKYQGGTEKNNDNKSSKQRDSN